jgi:hypothetical protein
MKQAMNRSRAVCVFAGFDGVRIVQIRQIVGGSDTHAQRVRGTDQRLRAHCAMRVAQPMDQPRG